MTPQPSLAELSSRLAQADALRTAGQHAEAQGILDDIVRICQSHPMPQDPGVKSLYARTCQVYATNFSDQGFLSQAETWALKAGELTADTRGEEEGTSIILLADIHRKQGKHAASVQGFQAGIAMLGADSIERADALGSLAHAEVAMGRIDQAITHRQQALAIAEHQQDPVAVGIFQGDLAKDYFFAGRLGEAESLVREALKGVDPAHPRCGSYSHKVLGDILLAQGKESEARDAYTHAIDTDNPHCRAMGLAGLGWLESRRGDLASAKTYFEQALAVQEEDKDLKTEITAGKALAQWASGEKESARETIAAALNDTATASLYAKGHVLAVQGAIYRGDKVRDAAQTVRASNKIFQQVARPLVHLSETLSTHLLHVREERTR